MGPGKGLYESQTSMAFLLQQSQTPERATHGRDPDQLPFSK
jgi:hypothetical protein